MGYLRSVRAEAVAPLWRTRGLPGTGRPALSPPLVFAAVGSAGSDPPVFSLDAVADGGRTIMRVAGELDIDTVRRFAPAAREALEAGGLRLDLRELDFMDSSGVRSINTVLREADERGRELHVVGPLRPAVRQVLELTGMLGLLPIEDGQP